MANMNNYIMRWRELSVDGVRSICPHHDGEWVKFADIKELLPTDNQQAKHKICPECGAKYIDNGESGLIECTCGQWL